MKAIHFDDLLRTVPKAASRRGVLRGFTVLALTAVGLPGAIDARNKHKRKKNKEIKRNDFGCVNVGGSCNSAGQCCSGICQGKKGKKQCRPHNVAECQADQDFCANPGIPSCRASGICYRTTGQGSFCGAVAAGACFYCKKDTDCEPDFGVGAACVVCESCTTVGSTGCAPAAP